MDRRPKLVSIFTGAGGLDIGLEEAGFETIAAAEIQDYACSTLRENKRLPGLTPSEFDSWFAAQLKQRCYSNATKFAIDSLRCRLRTPRNSHIPLQSAHIFEKDIRQLSSEEVLLATKLKKGQLDLIAGGPPCQPFSRAGKRESFENSDGRLFLEFVRLVRDLRPRWFIFENVKGLTFTKTEVIWRYCKSCKAKSLEPFELRYTSQASAPTCSCGKNSTQRVSELIKGGSLDIILNEFSQSGYSCTHTVLNAADYGAPQIRERLFIVGSRDNEPFQWPTPTHAGHKKNNQPLQLSLLQSDDPLQDWISVADSLWQDGHPVFGELDLSSAVLWVKNVVRPHAEPVTWTLDRPSPTVGAHQAAKLAIAPEGVPEEQLARQQWHTKGKRQRDLPPVRVEHEYLTDLELLRLQTFPDNWYLHGTRMQRAFQIGNAVPPTLARAIGEQLLCQ